MSGLTVTTRAGGSVAVLELNGEARREVVSELESATAEALDGGARHLLLDFSRLEFMDSASAGVLLRITKTSKDAGGRCIIYGVRSVVERLLGAMGLDEHFEISSDESTARARLL